MKTGILTAIFCASLCLTQASWAKTFDFPDYQCKCEVPDSWKIRPNTGNELVFASRPADGAVFLLSVKPAARWYTLADQMKASTALSSYLHPSDKDPQTYLTLDGQQFLSKTRMQEINGLPIYTHTLTILANGYLYITVISQGKVDPKTDEELYLVQKSFTFTSPPEIHTKEKLSTLAKLAEIKRLIQTDKAPWAWVGYVFAGCLILMRFLFLPLLGLFILLVVGVVLLWLKARSKRQIIS